MRLHFRTDIPGDIDALGWHTGRVREVRYAGRRGTAVEVLLEILTPFREGGAVVWWDQALCDTIECGDWRIDDQGRLVHSPAPRPTPTVSPALHAPGRSKRVAPALHALVEIHIQRPTLHTVGRLKLLADELLGDSIGICPKTVPTPKHARKRDNANTDLRALAHAMVLDPCTATYFEFLERAWQAYDAAEATLMRAREKTPAPKQNLHALYERYPHRTQFASADDPRIPGACQWPNPQDEQRARENLREDKRQARAEARAAKLAARKGGKA